MWITREIIDTISKKKSTNFLFYSVRISVFFYLMFVLGL